MQILQGFYSRNAGDAPVSARQNKGGESFLGQRLPATPARHFFRVTGMGVRFTFSRGYAGNTWVITGSKSAVTNPQKYTVRDAFLTPGPGTILTLRVIRSFGEITAAIGRIRWAGWQS